jgi:hypothetical protein
MISSGERSVSITVSLLMPSGNGVIVVNIVRFDMLDNVNVEILQERRGSVLLIWIWICSAKGKLTGADGATI